MIPETGSPEEVEYIWDLMSKRGSLPGRLHRLEYSLSCPNRPTAEFVAQYLEHRAGFSSAPPSPSVSHDGHEYWDLQLVSGEGHLSLAFLRQSTATVRAVTRTFGCHLYAWGKYSEGAA